MRTFAITALLPLAAASSDPLADRVAGPAVRCIDGATTTNGPEVVDRRTILYRRGATIYRTSIDSCPALRPMTTLIVELYGSQICRKDRFRVLESGALIPSAYCFFGDFVPYTKAGKR